MLRTIIYGDCDSSAEAAAIEAALDVLDDANLAEAYADYLESLGEPDQPLGLAELWLAAERAATAEMRRRGYASTYCALEA